jgi:cytochrome c553
MKTLALLALLWSTALPAAAPSGDIAAGMARSVACQACHGADGVSISAEIPNLAGQKPQYLAAQLKAFRAGERKHDIMNPIAKQLSDADIVDLAAFWNSLPPAAAGRETGAGALAARRSTLAFPAVFPRGFVAYRTDEDREAGRVSTFLANALARDAAQAGKPLPPGSIIVVAMAPAKKGEDGKPLSDASGHLVGDAPRAFSAMELKPGAGAEFPELLRNGDWIYALFDKTHARNESVNHAMCLGCHKAVAADSYVFSLEQLRKAKKADPST